MKVNEWLVRLIGTICLFMMAQSSLASIVYTTVEARGFGQDEGEALQDALKVAIAQVCGERIAANTRLTREVFQSNTEYRAQKSLERDVRSQTKGIIHSYRIIGRGNDDRSSRAFVEVEAQVPTYRSDIQTNRLKLAIFPLSVDSALARNPNAVEFARGVAAALESSLVQTRRFAVIDNLGGGARGVELAKLAAPDVPISQTIRAAQGIIADYVVLAHVRTFDAQERTKTRVTGRQIDSLVVNLALDLRIVDVDTGQVKFALTESGTRSVAAGGGLSDIAAKLGSRLGRQISGSIYPMVVVAARPTSVTLNEGGQNIVVGSRYAIHAAGSEMTDPYTGEPLGPEEVQIAVVRIQSITDRTSTASLIEGELPLNAPSGALIARPLQLTLEESVAEFREQAGKLREAVQGAKKERDDAW